MLLAVMVLRDVVLAATGCALGQYATQIAQPDNTGVILRCIDCPLGRYGASYSLTSANCSGRCDAGFHCPPGSTSRTQEQCASAAVATPRDAVAYYCPLGYRG